MTSNSDAELLGALDLFADAPAADLARLAGLLRRVDVGPGSVLMREGETADSFLIVTSGAGTATRMLDGAPFQVGVIGRGSVVGELGLLRGTPRNATVTAVTTLGGYVGDADAFCALLEIAPVADRILSTARRRVARVAAPVPVTLKDGSVVGLRPVLPEDRVALGAMSDRLSPLSRYRRFFHSWPLPDSAVAYLTDIDYVSHFAWVAIPQPEAGAEQRLLGGGRYVRMADAPERAELGLAIADDLQGRGLGTAIMGALAVAAHENGIRVFEGYVSDDNPPVHRLLARAMPRWDSGEDGLLHVSFAVPAPQTYLPDGATAGLLREVVRVVVFRADQALHA